MSRVAIVGFRVALRMARDLAAQRIVIVVERQVPPSRIRVQPPS
jgi:hypothetical protein